MAGLLEFYTVFHLAEEDAADGPVHDPCAVLAVTHPELFALEANSCRNHRIDHRRYLRDHR
jgi:inosine-uridine nucleoside N-ribohydrolase